MLVKTSNLTFVINFITLLGLVLCGCATASTPKTNLAQICTQITYEDLFIKQTSLQYLSSINNQKTPEQSLDHLINFIGIEQGSIAITSHRLNLLAENASSDELKIINQIRNSLNIFNFALKNAHRQLLQAIGQPIAAIKATMTNVSHELVLAHNKLAISNYSVIKELNKLPKSELKGCIKS